MLPSQSAAPLGAAETSKPKQPAKRLWRKGFLVAGTAILALVAGLAGYLLAPQVMSVRLVDYEDGSGYSLKVPAGYTTSTDGTTTRVVERRDGIITSGVIITNQQIVPLLNVTEEEKTQEQLKAAAPSMLAGMLENQYSVEQLTLTKAENKDGYKMYRASAELVRNGNKGEGTMSIVITDGRMYAVGVVSHTANTKLLDQANVIIDSFSPGR